MCQPGASETASHQGAGEGEVDVLPEAEGGPEGCQIEVQREGISNFLHIGKSETTNLSPQMSVEKFDG